MILVQTDLEDACAVLLEENRAGTHSMARDGVGEADVNERFPARYERLLLQDTAHVLLAMKGGIEVCLLTTLARPT